MKSVRTMTDDEVLEQARDMGPAIIGEELYKRAQSIQRDNPGGVLGPAFFDAGASAVGQAGKNALAVKEPGGKASPTKPAAKAAKAPAPRARK